MLALLFLAVFRPDTGSLKNAEGWVGLTALALFVMGLLVAMFRFLARTDAGRAAEGYVAAVLPRARASGRRFGRIQARAIEMGDLLRSLPTVTTSPNLVAGEWRVDVFSPRHGLFSPSRAGLRRLLAADAFSAGMRLRLFAGLGTIVRARQHVASLVPAPDQTVPRNVQQQAKRLLRTRSSYDVEGVATGSVALVQVALDLARAGDTGTADSVARHAVRLITEHSAAARNARAGALRRYALRAKVVAHAEFRSGARPAQARNQARDSQIAPVIPALRDALRLAVKGQLDRNDGLFSVSAALIEPLLASTGEAEAVVSMLTFAVPIDGDGESYEPARRAILLRLAGIRALELGASISFGLLLDRLDRLSRLTAASADAIRVTSQLAATACRFDVRLSRMATDHVLVQTAGGGVAEWMKAWRVMALWRIGAASLSSGALSVAVHAAAALCEHGEDTAVVAAARNQDAMDAEVMLSNSYGGYLGDQAKDALAELLELRLFGSVPDRGQPYRVGYTTGPKQFLRLSLPLRPARPLDHPEST